MRLVLDTNVVVSGLLWNGPPEQVLSLGRSGDVLLFTSMPLLQELTDVLCRFKFSRKLAASSLSAGQLVARYGDLATVVSPVLVSRIAPDPDDDVVIGTALAARADFIVTGDRLLLSVKQYQGGGNVVSVGGLTPGLVSALTRVAPLMLKNALSDIVVIMSGFVSLAEFHAAQERIARVAKRTCLHRITPAQLETAGYSLPSFDLYVKAESEQPIGSFKLRGAYNKIAQMVELDPRAAAQGFITYSSGNHAQGVAHAARAVGARAVIVMPENAPEIKKQATAALGAEIVIVGNASSDRRRKAEELAAEFGYAMIPPYDDPAIIAGQGTCGLELLEQAGAGGSLLVLSPVSGGGLLSGIATAVKLTSPEVQVWGAEPELAADAKESFETRTLVEWPAAKTTRTIGDGLRTQSLGALNFEHVLRYVDGIVTVSEEEIFSAMRFLLAATDLVPEPSGAVTLAAALFHSSELPKVERIVAVLSGGNIEPALKSQLYAELQSVSGIS